MYVERHIARSRNHFCDENATIPSVCIVKLHVTVNNIKYWMLHKNAFMANLCGRQT